MVRSPTTRTSSFVGARWRKREQERARCRKILNRATPTVAAFYANPRLPPQLGLGPLPSLTREMRHLMQTISPFDVAVEPCTSLDILHERVRQYRPRVVLYSGHAVRHSLLLENERGNGVAGTHEQVHAAVDHSAIQILIFLGCHTCDVLRRVLHPWQVGIGFVTQVEDDAARAFAHGLVLELAKQVRTRRFEVLKLFSAGEASMKDAGYLQGDPKSDPQTHGIPLVVVA